MEFSQHSQIQTHTHTHTYTHMHTFLLPLGKLFKSIISFSLKFLKRLLKNYLIIIGGGTLGATEKHRKFLAVCPGHRGVCHAVQVSPGVGSPDPPLVGGHAQSRGQEGTGQR